MPRDDRQPELPFHAARGLRLHLKGAGWLGLVVFPLALAVYLITLPLFALFWLIDWALPVPQSDAGLVDSDLDTPPVSSRIQDSPSR